ncbi:MAG: DUF2490 domain-containing protein [Flavobacteriales bacterium]|nr:DUF2490 domain-containing protein [Flavobacteriales bacterium]
MKSFIGLLFILSLPLFGLAQHTKTVRNNQQWVQNYVSLRVSERIHVLTDASFRTRDWFQHPASYLVRAGVTYNVHPRWKLGVGFAHTGTFVDSDIYKLEYRPYQDVISQHVFSNVEITNRLRIEERIQRVLFNDSLVPFSARIRLRFQVAAPVFSLSKTHPERKLFIILADEFLLNAGNTIKYNILDQNRMMIGPSFRVSDHLDIALLYSYQFGTTTKPNVFKQDHVLWLTLSHKFDLRKKDKEDPSSIRTLGE